MGYGRVCGNRLRMALSVGLNLSKKKYPSSRLIFSVKEGGRNSRPDNCLGKVQRLEEK